MTHYLTAMLDHGDEPCVHTMRYVEGPVWWCMDCPTSGWRAN